MADYTDTDFDDSFNSRVRESNNTTTTNSTTNVGVDFNDVGNTDSSTNGSGNLAVDLDGVGNVDSHDTRTDIDGSFNDWSDNSVRDWSDNSVDDHSDNSVTDNSDNSWVDDSDRSITDNSDNSVNGSHNDESSHLVKASYNSYLDESVDDHSIEVGTREYNTGFGNLNLGGAGGGGGDVWIDNRNTIVDQSQNTAGWGGAEGGSSAVVASGDGATAAGNNVNLSQSIDRSESISAHGDVNLGNDTRITTVTDSYNETTETSSWTDESTHLDVEDSYNTESASWSATNSFNDELTSQSEHTWDVDADVIWGSEDALIVDVPTMDDPYDGS